MQNIKKFREYQPTPAQLAADLQATGKTYRYLISEDGLDWYDCQALFSDSTIKLMYDNRGVIRAVVAEPVPGRGNIYAVSMFFPAGMSVAETDVALPDGFELNTLTWVFDGRSVYQDADLLAADIQRRNQKVLSVYMTRAASLTFAIQSSSAIGNPRDGDSDNLLALQQYADALRDVDLTVEKPDWPAIPSFIQ